MSAIIFDESMGTSHVEVVKVYNINTMRIKKHIITFVCVLADIVIPIGMDKIDYMLIYNIIINKVKNKVFLCKKIYGYMTVYLYDIQEQNILNTYINNLLVLAMMNGKKSNELLYDYYEQYTK